MVCEDTNHGEQRKNIAPEERNIPRNIIRIEFSSSGAAQAVYKLIFGIEYNA